MGSSVTIKVTRRPARRNCSAMLTAAPAPSELTLFALAATYPTQKAAAHLGWQPRIGLDEGLADSVAWLRTMGLTKGLAQ